MSIHLENLYINHEASNVLPLLQLRGQMQNAVLQNVNVTCNLTTASEKIIRIETGPLSGSKLNLTKIMVKQTSSAAVEASIQGFDVAVTTDLSLSGGLGVVGFRYIGEIQVTGGVWDGNQMNVRFSNTRRAAISQLTARYVELRLSNTLSATISGSSFYRTALSTGSASDGACLTAILAIQFTRSKLEECSYSLHWGGKPCNAILYLPSFIKNTFVRSFEANVAVALNARGNYWSSKTGPTICSNPGGVGATVNRYTDYSAWCEDSSCLTINSWPLLLPQVLADPCRSPSGGDIAAFTIIFFLFVAIHVTMLIIYCIYCGPRKTGTQNIQIHYARMSARMSLVAALCIVLIAVTGAIGSAACPTRVYSRSCPFTLTDRAVAGNGLLFASVTVLIAVASVVLLRNNYHEQRPILYTCLAYQAISLCLSIVIIVISLMGLSSPLYGPYMHLLAVPAGGYIIFSAIQMWHLYNLRAYCRHTIIALELADYKNEHASLIRNESPATKVARGDPEMSPSDEVDHHRAAPKVVLDAIGDPIDEYSVPGAKAPLQVFYSNYMRVTVRWLVAENVTCAALLAFSIWYTLTSYKVVGGLLIASLLLEYFRIVAAIYVIRSSGPILGFKSVMVFTGLLKIGLLAIGVFLYVQVFTLSSHTSAYFAAAFMAPLLGIGAITTIRIWKMFEAVFEKKHKLQL